MALRVTLSTPDSDRASYTREEPEAKIKVSLGGRRLKRDFAADPVADRRGGAPNRRRGLAAVTQLLAEHREQLDSLTHALLQAETLDGPDAYAAADVSMRTADSQVGVSA